MVDLRYIKNYSRTVVDVNCYYEDIELDLDIPHRKWFREEEIYDLANHDNSLLFMAQVTNVLLKDILGVISAWRQARGYPKNGQRTRTNAKTSKRVKYLYLHRISQMILLYRRRKRNIFPTLVLAEYVNRLWYYNWRHEWDEAHNFVMLLVTLSKTRPPFNPVLLAKAQTNGYTRSGSALKLGKAKKITKTFTIGVPVFFTQWIYEEPLPEGFPTKLYIEDETRRQMGKKKSIKKQK